MGHVNPRTIKHIFQNHFIPLLKHYKIFRINLPLFSTVLPSNSCCFCHVGLSFLIKHFQQVICINKERPTGQKQQLLDGRTVKNKGKLILTEIFPSVQTHDI